ncbi:uncharacterized protein LOC126746831 [Anthonomus grandis grandis]|uniref:uncharacterized protein LOC126746831 n=1 Tax=Anthonomus grandis grandis TaxID=2921223 RepID=UPI00216504D3|nr:uncharacterized protein LOC126746831 [Anthonomus grandis grandis]
MSKQTPTYFVTQTNPEIFEVTPRPGGHLKIDIPPKVNKLAENAAKAAQVDKNSSTKRRSANKIRPVKQTKTPSETDAPTRKSLLTVTTTSNTAKELDIDSCPREFKVKQIIAATPWSVEFDEYLEPPEDLKRIPDPFQDSVDMLAMSISVIMLLARGYQGITETHYKWIWSYLECIKDEFGKTPPNVQGVLNHISEATGGKIVSFLDEDDDDLNVTSPVKLDEGPADDAPAEE